MKPLFLILIGCFLVAVLAIGLIWSWTAGAVTRGFTHGLGDTLNARVTFQDVSLDLLGGRITADRGAIRNLDPQASWNDAEVGHAEANFKLGELFHRVTPMEIVFDNVTLRLGVQANQELVLGGSPAAPVTTSAHPGWPHIEVQKLALHHGAVKGDNLHPFSAANIELVAEKNTTDAGWTGSGKCQNFTLRSLSFGLTTGRFATSDTDITVENYQSVIGGSGTITGHASLPMDPHQPARIHYELTNVSTSALLPANWDLLLIGLAQGSGDYEGPLGDCTQGTAKGTMALRPASLKALPFLDKLAVVPGMAGLGQVNLDTARTDYTYNHGLINLTNLRLEKLGQVALSGDLAINPDGTMNGAMKLGLAPGMVSMIPKLQEQVFTTPDTDYCWADVHVTGTSDHLIEDLSPRIASAVADQAKSIFQGAAKGAADLFNQLLGK